ncbi:carbonic anhydrase [Rhodoferax mekongensis]|uniref:carbonic anhydrase n=1 Tax=Rhodoferax mekongensis TaxID=3068341 RepID=A0ABZ0B054_9BURK|nr:carbonic anhydrase family protein [Rhodoferax sp. TBRC 17307]WNO04786.1 carbonic anhydrase family protein [Rhodoferax sp. TBRC 17307]
MPIRPPSAAQRLRPKALIALLLAALCCAPAWANDAEPAAKAATKAAKKEVLGEISATSASNAKEVGDHLREALGAEVAGKKKLLINVSKVPGGTSAPAASGRSSGSTSGAGMSSRQYIQARAAALAGHGDTAQIAAAGAPAADAHGSEVHWTYEGENGPQAWGKLKPDFNICAIGKRQSPINIEEGTTLQGPAEPVQFNYTPSSGTVVNNGHTIQVDVQGDNNITVRGSRYRLLQFHFHTPSEESVNYKRFAMVAHLVHKNDEGQLAVVAVLLDPGSAPNPLIDKVWTYMPLDAGDRVRMPRELLNMNELLPSDQRYYQFIGSLTTPPCTEGVLWMVLKQPMAISRNQLRLFTQLYPMNARPVQPLNGRPVRDAQ